MPSNAALVKVTGALSGTPVFGTSFGSLPTTPAFRGYSGLDIKAGTLAAAYDNSGANPDGITAWDLNGKNLWHIGIVVGEDLFVHNIGGGPELSRGIHSWEVVGHYRYHPASTARDH